MLQPAPGRTMYDATFGRGGHTRAFLKQGARVVALDVDPAAEAEAEKLTAELGEPKWIQMSERIAHIMRTEKKLEANVDFYSATVYYSLGLPTDLFTPIFAVARMAGWTGHVLEQWSDNRLFRPDSEYVGPALGRKVVPLSKR